MDVPPGSGVTSETSAPQAALLRRAWFEVAATAAPQLPDLPDLLDECLADLEATGRVDEPGLLAIAEAASQHALEAGAGDVARTLSKRLRRAIYEFLLALDAVNPAELAPGGVPAAAPPPALVPAPGEPAPRAPVGFTLGDVSGGDDAPEAGSDHAGEPVVEAPQVPLWEQMSAPEKAREVYRVASREVTPVADAAPYAPETDAAEAPEVGPSAEAAALLDVEDGVGAANPDLDTEALVAEVFDAVEGVEEASSLEVTVGEAPSWEPEVDGEVLDAALGSEALDGDGTVESAVATEEVEWGIQPEVETAEDQFEAQPVGEVQSDVEVPEAFEAPAAEAVEEWVAEAPETVEETAPEQPVAEQPAMEQPVAEAFAPEQPTAEAHEEPAAEAPAAMPESTWAPVVDIPAAEAPNGTKPPRDLLRVPRQFRRLPPLPRPDAQPLPAADTELAGAPVAEGWSAAPAMEPELPAEFAPPAAETVAEAHVEPVIEAAAEPAAEAPEVLLPEEDDLFGVPALPWPAEAAEPVAEAFEVPTAEEPEEEMGLPFDPLAAPVAEAPASFVEPAAPAAEWLAASAPAPAADPFAAAPDEDLPRPPVEWTVPTAAAPAADPFAAAPAEPAWDLAPPAPPASPFPIAPREGFHLTDPGALDAALAETDGGLPQAPADNPFTTAIPPVNVPPQVSVAPPAPAPSQAPPPAAAPQGHAHEHGDAEDDANTWRIRQSPRAQLLAERMAQKRREEAARAAFEAASVSDDSSRGRRKRKHDDSLPDLPSARRQLDEHLRRKRGAEAAALLQRLAQGLGGRDIADLALDAGDRCRALGQSRSATNCYLAAWRADPLYETPLWRLSDVCLNEQEIDLAVGYLERIADLMRSRGDDEGAIGVYRKIAMIAPERQDVRDVIRLAKTTGRLDV